MYGASIAELVRLCEGGVDFGVGGCGVGTKLLCIAT